MQRDNTTELTYSIFCTAAESGERIGTVHISVEATTVGSGILLSQDVDIYEGETAAETVVRMLQNNGYSVDYTGNYETGFIWQGLVPRAILSPEIFRRI